MSLPDLALQIAYGRLAWGLVAAAMLLAVLPALYPAFARCLTRRTKLIAAAAAMALMALPGAASPAYWLTLTFQYPSGLLVGCCLVSLHARWAGRPVRFALRPALALALAAAGLLLYLDSFGVLALELYAAGFHRTAAPLLACAAAAACVLTIVGRRPAATAAALLAALLLFSLLRLPSGNLWDALLDPLLWAWALGSSIDAAARRYAARKAGASRRSPQPSASPITDPAPAHTAGLEQGLE